MKMMDMEKQESRFEEKEKSETVSRFFLKENVRYPVGTGFL